MESLIKKLIDTKNYEELKEALSQNPSLVNEGVPFDETNTTNAHPLHRICDGVFSQKYSDEEAVEMAKIFLDHGANINGNEVVEKTDTPLVAAASLCADETAIFYIEHGADIDHPGCYGGTALHWAAWCGRPKVVEKLIHAHAIINKKCIDFKATPLFWAVHGLKNSGSKNERPYLECVNILLQAGAEKNIPNADGNTVFDLLDDADVELKKLLNE